MRNSCEPRPGARGSALLITLLLLAVLAMLVITMFQAVSTERRLAADFKKDSQAKVFAQMAADDAMQALQAAVAELDDPFGTNAPPATFWASAPGRIDKFSLSPGSSRPQRLGSYPLHSGLDSSRELVDLNATNAAGVRAIWPDQSPNKTMSVNWKAVRPSPGDPAAATNRIVGRYAYWVDDESSKININTGDGTELYTQKSYGAGTPSAVQLAIGLPSLSPAEIKEIVAEAISSPFADISEVERIPGSTGTKAVVEVRNRRFILTEYSRSLEFNIFNEPRFQLASFWGGNRAINGTTAVTPGTPTSYVPAPGLNRLPLDFRFSLFPGASNSRNFPSRSIYPTPMQFNGARRNVWPYLPQIAIGPAGNIPVAGRRAGTIASLQQINGAVDSVNNFAIPTYNSQERFAAALTLAGYLAGTNSVNQPITWPFSEANYTSKYSIRQIDSIVVQALDRVNLAIYGVGNTPALLAPYGVLGTEPVIGQGNSPKLCEILFEFNWSDKRNSGAEDGGFLTSKMWAKGFLPAHYLNPISTLPSNAFGALSQINGLNFQGTEGSAPYLQAFDSVPFYHADRNMTNFSAKNFAPNGLNGYPGGASYYRNPWVTDSSIAGANTNPYMSYWGDSLLQAVDQNGLSAGIDFNMHPRGAADPDPRATSFRKDGRGTNPNPANSEWGGTVWAQGRGDASRVSAGTIRTDPGVAYQESGAYAVVRNWAYNLALPSRDYYGTNFPQPLIASGPYRTPVTSITLRGGFNYRVHRFGFEGFLEMVPLAAMAGPVNELPNRMFSKTLPDANASIPFPANVTVNAATPVRYVHAQVADPMVNKMVGDWTVTQGTTAPAHTLGNITSSSSSYRVSTPNSGSVDLAASWGPVAMDLIAPVGGAISKNTITPTLNLPSVGSLQYIRTKMMPPDDSGNSTRGQPFRCLSLAGASDATQSGIPDWALLDLFTVPQSVYDKPGSIETSGATKVINLTYGGATTGKINPNGSVLFPWAETDGSFVRPEPLTAIFANLRYNRDGTTNFTTLSPGDAAALASGVSTFIRTNGPLSMAGQICDIPAMNAYGASVNPTRNDIASQSLGLLETRSCVFSVWVVAQAVAKRPGNTNYGDFEPGDFIQAEKRYRYTVERYLDLGVDGVAGNAKDPGPDNVIGSLDDPADPVYHPTNPKFRYRIVNVQEIL